MAGLRAKVIKDSFRSILRVDSDSGLTGSTLVQVEDGDGVNTALLIATDKIAATELKTDTISEQNSASGVTIDGVVVKDNAVTASGGFTGALTGLASSATAATSASTSVALTNPRTIGGVAFNGTTNIVPNTIVVADSGADTTCNVALFSDATGSLQPKTDAGITYNASTNTLATTNIAISGELDAATLDISGVVQIDGATTFGVNDTGVDVKFYGASSGAYSLWDQANDRLLFTDNAGAAFGSGGDMHIFHEGSNSYITNQTGNMNLATLHTGIAVNIGHTTSETTVKDNLNITGSLVGTRVATKNLADDGTIPITATCVDVDADGSARTGIRFAGTGVAGQIIIVNNTGGEKLTFHGTASTALVRGIHADHDVMETLGVYIFVSDGALWNYIGGGVDSQPDLGLAAS